MVAEADVLYLWWPKRLASICVVAKAAGLYICGGRFDRPIYQWWSRGPVSMPVITKAAGLYMWWTRRPANTCDNQGGRPLYLWWPRRPSSTSGVQGSQPIAIMAKTAGLNTWGGQSGRPPYIPMGIKDGHLLYLLWPRRPAGRGWTPPCCPSWPAPWSPPGGPGGDDDVRLHHPLPHHLCPHCVLRCGPSPFNLE